jgi:hypothetical protein
LRLVTWNVQWFDRIFDQHGALLADAGPGGREGVARGEQAGGIAVVLQALDADAILVIEAPDARRLREGQPVLASFAKRVGIRAHDVLMGFPSLSGQEIALLFDPAALEARHDPASGDPPRFDGVFRVDLDGDGRAHPVRWAKPPLEADIRTASGSRIRLIGVHAKSKVSGRPRDEEHGIRVAIENRRKQLAQCVWLRARVERHLEAGESLIVMGDFNDGPGLDEYEVLFGRSGVEIVMSEGGAGRLFDPHARQAARRATAAVPSTARFRVPPDGRWLSALLDYVMISPDLCARNPRWRIWHPFDDPACYRDPELRHALLHASDHFPVSLDLDI